MSNLLLSEEDKGVIVFHVWKSLPYNLRLLLAFFLIVVGFLIQYYGSLLPGLFFLVGGNSLLLVKGYDNRIKLGKLKLSGEWVKTDRQHIEQIIELNKKMRFWDRSAFDVTNASGRALFIFFLSVLFIFWLLAYGTDNYYMQFLAVDAAFLFIPHWLSGLKRITTLPFLMLKIGIYKKLLKDNEEIVKDLDINFMVYVKGEDAKLPTDIKMKVDFKNAPEDFMGMYAQISLNNVQGRYYPYFYVVLVAKNSLQMTNKYFNRINVSRSIIKEKSNENNLDIIIIRQHTTKTSGYHTPRKVVNKIFLKGLAVAEIILNGEKNT